MYKKILNIRNMDFLNKYKNKLNNDEYVHLENFIKNKNSSLIIYFDTNILDDLLELFPNNFSLYDIHKYNYIPDLIYCFDINKMLDFIENNKGKNYRIVCCHEEIKCNIPKIILK